MLELGGSKLCLSFRGHSHPRFAMRSKKLRFIANSWSPAYLNSSRRAALEMATTAGCCSLRSAEMA